MAVSTVTAPPSWVMPSGVAPRRIHIAGGPGAGKTTLARRLAGATGLAVHHLDDIARVGGGTGRVREAAEREPLVRAILESDGWITEGVHLGWTEPLLASADLIVWLDAASGPVTSGRIADRFARDAWAQMRRRSWRERVAGVPGYARHARDLAGAVIDARRYDRAASAADGSPSPIDPNGTLGSRPAMMAALAGHAERLVHCRTDADIADVAARVIAAWASAGAASGRVTDPGRAPARS